MLPIFMVYIVISLAFGFIGVANANTDKFNYSMGDSSTHVGS